MKLKDIFNIVIDGIVPCLCCGEELTLDDYNIEKNYRKAECDHCNYRNTIILYSVSKDRKVIGLSINVEQFRIRINSQHGYVIGSYGAGDQYDTYYTGKIEDILDKPIAQLNNEWARALLIFS